MHESGIFDFWIIWKRNEFFYVDKNKTGRDRVLRMFLFTKTNVIRKTLGLFSLHIGIFINNYWKAIIFLENLHSNFPLTIQESQILDQLIHELIVRSENIFLEWIIITIIPQGRSQWDITIINPCKLKHLKRITSKGLKLMWKLMLVSL